MVAAECNLKTVNDPFSKKVPKKYKCPTGYKCLKLCPGEEEDCEDDKREIYVLLQDTLVIGYNISNPIKIKTEEECIKKCRSSEECLSSIFYGNYENRLC